MKLRAQATLTTRLQKQFSFVAELTDTYRSRVSGRLGQHATAWTRIVRDILEALLLQADEIPLDVITVLGSNMVEAVGEKRST